MTYDARDYELEVRLRGAAPPAPTRDAAPVALSALVLAELRRRRVRRRAACNGMGALVLAAAATTWWVRLSPPAVDAAPSLAVRGPVESAELVQQEWSELQQRIDLQRRLVESLERAERCAAYEQVLAKLPPIGDPFRETRVELERAAWLMLDGVERSAAAGAPLEEQIDGYAEITQVMSGTYWAGVAEQRRQQLAQGTGT